MFNSNFEYKIHNKVVDNSGNYILLDLTIDNRRITLGTVYGPNKDTPGFYEQLFENLESLNNASIILCGDWNIVMDYDQDTKGYLGQNNKKARDTLLPKNERF